MRKFVTGEIGMRIRTRLSIAAIFIAFIAMGLMVACVADIPTAPPPDCSRLDYWTTDGQGGCIEFTHKYSTAQGKCVASPTVIPCP